MHLPLALCPPPKQLELQDGFFHLGDSLSRPACDSLADAAFIHLERALGNVTCQLVVDQTTPQLLVRLDSNLDHQAYRLTISVTGIEVAATGRAGLIHGIQTLAQLVYCCGRELPCLSIVDQPAFERRGFMLDISRNKVPTMATLVGLIDDLCLFKYNELQLYTEHTFAYRDHQAVWADASPMTAAEIQQLGDDCAARGIELVPNQNSFGHFHRWLTVPGYEAFAECPEGVSHPFSLEKEPFSLCAVESGVVDFLDGLYRELLPNFKSPFFNVGLDETFDLGEGRSKAACEREGKSRVYLNFLKTIHERVSAQGRRMMFWGDIIINAPELVTELPSDVIALEWGYEADHPFAEHGAIFKAAGRDFYVCPGTSAWNSFAGRIKNMEGNALHSAREGLRHGAMGYLMTEWGDRGHLQPVEVAYPGLIMGAASSWAAPREIPSRLWQDAYDGFVLGRPGVGVGAFLSELGNLYDACGFTHSNGSPLFFLWWSLQDAATAKGRIGTPDLATYRALLTKIEALEVPAVGGLVEEHLRWLVGMMAWCAKLGCYYAANDLEVGSRLSADLRQGLDALCQTRKALWMQRNRPGGWQLSEAFFKDRHQPHPQDS